MESNISLGKEEINKYLGASDIVNSTANLYIIKEKEMESALKEIYKEIGYTEME